MAAEGVVVSCGSPADDSWRLAATAARFSTVALVRLGMFRLQKWLDVGRQVDRGWTPKALRWVT